MEISQNYYVLWIGGSLVRVVHYAPVKFDVIFATIVMYKFRIFLNLEKQNKQLSQ